jgi:hypothetical protein
VLHILDTQNLRLTIHVLRVQCAVCSGATSALPQRSSLICWKGWRANGLPVPVGAASLLHRRGRWKGAEFAPVL